MVYLQFFAKWSTSSLAEMEMMVELKKKYGRYFDFVSISIDENKGDFDSFLKKHSRFKWEFGWIGDDPTGLYKYRVINLPLFYLFDSEGKIIIWPALWPSSGIEEYFYRFDKKKVQNKNKDYWNDRPKN